MNYIKQNFEDGNKLKAKHLNHMEDGISNAVTKPSAAKVGQFLYVKAVDENGSPTEWDTIDSDSPDVALQTLVNAGLITPATDGETIFTDEAGNILLIDEKEQNEVIKTKPLVLYAEKASEYEANATIGDETLSAILAGRQILVNTPNADGGTFTEIFSPIYHYQLPNYENEYLYLFYLRDEKQDLDLSALGKGTIELPVYGELQMKLSTKYNECPLK